MSDSLGAVLKEARRRRGLRVKDLAVQTKAAISPSYLSCIENDLRLPSEELLLELAELLTLDGRQLYMQLVRQKAPAAIRDTLFGPTLPTDNGYESLRGLSLEEVVEQAAQSVLARRDAQEARKELARLKRSTPTTTDHDSTSGFLARWQHDANRYRMLIEKTVVDMSLSIDGDAVILHHTVGLRPLPNRPPVLSLQHQVNLLHGTTLSEKDGYFKLLEAPADVPVEIQRQSLGAHQGLIRVLFPDGLGFEEGSGRSVSYTVRSVLHRSYAMEATPEVTGDILSDHRGARGRFYVTVDKPCEALQLIVGFPQYYIPEEVEAWAGTQLPSDTDDNFIDMGTCVSWKLEVGVDYRATLTIERPLVGMRYAILWRPLSSAEYSTVKSRLELGDDDEVADTPQPGVRKSKRRNTET